MRSMIKIYLEEIVESFGTRRILFGSGKISFFPLLLVD